jgi:superfamily II DNA or RNA helicase
MASLLKHQEEPIDHIINKCSKQKGIILYHHMGTGKTITALFFLLHFSKKTTKTLLICPDEIKVVWVDEIRKMGFPKNTIDQIVGFSKLQTVEKMNLKDTVVVVDEAHNLVKWFYENKNKIQPVIEKLQNCKKSLLLTGTPVYQDETDILFLINIVAGKDIVPYHEDQFRQKYFKTKVMKSIVQGWGVKFFKFDYINRYESILNGVPVQLFERFIFPLLMLTVTTKLNNKTLVSITGKIQKLLSFKDKVLITPRIGNFISKIVMKSKKVSEIFEMMPDLPSSLVFALFFQIALGILSAILKKTDKTKLHDFQQIDPKKFSKDIAPYLSYYAVPASPEFPSVKEEICKVAYSDYQISLWLKANLHEFDENLNVDSNKYIKNYNGVNEFKSQGRMIGNLEKESYPLKFKKVFEIMKEKQAVIYSSFHEKGGKLFSKFLDESNYPHVCITPSMSQSEISSILVKFKNKTIKCLILHYKFTEGISILGANQLHILEPLENFAKYDQLKARVVRYQSHVHLPKEEQKVTIYTWVVTMNSVRNELSVKMQFTKKWAKNYSMMLPDEMTYEYVNNQLVTPDEMNMISSEKMALFVKDLTKNLKTQAKTCPNNEEYKDRCTIAKSVKDKSNCQKLYM